jgi:hypothetical protein
MDYLRQNWLALVAVVLSLSAILRPIVQPELMPSRTIGLDYKQSNILEDKRDGRMEWYREVADKGTILGDDTDRELIQGIAGWLYQLELDVAIISDSITSEHRTSVAPKTESE